MLRGAVRLILEYSAELEAKEHLIHEEELLEDLINKLIMSKIDH